MKAVLYGRVSRREQAQGYSLDTQLQAMREFCRKHGWTVAAELEEPGFTGTTGKRPAFQQALDACFSGQAEILVTLNQNRFFRDAYEKLDLLRRFKEHGIAYASVDDNLIVWDIDALTYEQWIALGLMTILDEAYSRELSRKTKRGKAARAKDGKSNASTTPYGYRRAEGLDVPDPATSPAVLLAFETYIQGQHSDTDIADLLNREGHPASGRAKSGRWTREGVRYLLCNPFYAGWVRHGTDLHPGQHEPIITQELFDQVAALRSRRNAGRGGPRRGDRVYLLQALGVCAHCGLPLVCETHTNKGKADLAQYRCNADRRGFACGSPRRYVAAHRIDPQVDALIARLRLPENWRERLQELAEHQEERHDLEGRRNYLRGKLKRLRTLFLEGDYTKPEYDREKHDLQAQLDALREPEPPEVEQAGVTLEALADAYRVAPVGLQAAMLREIFQEIRVDLGARRVVAVKPWPPFVPLFRLDGLGEKEAGVFYEEVGPES